MPFKSISLMGFLRDVSLERWFGGRASKRYLCQQSERQGLPCRFSYSGADAVAKHGRAY